MIDGQAEDVAKPNILCLDGVVSGYGDAAIINSVSLTLQRGEILALLGKNGMGKTTLLKTILGFVPLRLGNIVINDASVTSLSPARLIASGVGYAPQEQPLFQDLSIRDNLRLAVRSDRLLGPALGHVFGFFPFFKERLGQKAGTLSGGEQKMLILARALMLRPRLLLIDEISEGLQPSVVDRIGRVLTEERRQFGTSILLIEQNLDFALSIANRWAVLKRGEIDDYGGQGPEVREQVLNHLKI
jgi:ABC-type branched-subunit amino acid transport system ATPase component